jgi:iron-sulfur cluster repair protein YtfE (RIC family)
MADLTVNHLRRHHQKTRGFLAQLTSLLDSLSANPEWTEERRESFGQIARYFEKDLYALVREEDQVLYPALEGLLPADSGPILLLRIELTDLCASFRKHCEIGKSLRVGENPPKTIGEFQHFGRKAIEVLEDHLYKEERVLFPMAARFITPPRDRELLQQMKSLGEAKDPLPSSYPQS